ncbi:MAG: DUF1015 family protein [Lachnospiraceae bacterium]|nr:DUF1015 family protein [Lachnospiraceae bacterium]
MAVFRPFSALRPSPELAQQVAALPYDVMNSAEAREMVVGNPYSFLHVDKAEIDLDPSIDLYDEQVYAKAAENLKKMETDGVMIRDDKPCYYIYRQIMGEHAQAGIVGCASIDDYLDGTIKKHELTVAEKEADRIHHVDTCDANTGPIFLTFRPDALISEGMKKIMDTEAPVYDFTAEDDIRHTVWTVSDPEVIGKLGAAFGEVPCLYIADGHHRAASAVRVGQRRRASNPGYTGEEEFNYFLAVAFPSDELSIWDYNRVVKDLKGMSEAEFIDTISGKFTVRELTADENPKPSEKHHIGMYLGGKWYALEAKEGTYDAQDPVSRLDVSILQNNLLTPVLGIEDPRTDKRIKFVGGVRGLEELVRLVDEGAAAAFAMYPTTLDDLMDIADSGQIMPPKSTWFEPKLRSGLFIHSLS